MRKLLETAAPPGADVRVVSMSSMAHKVFIPKEAIIFGDLHTTMEKTGGAALYGQAMIAKIIMARQLAKRYPKIMFMSVHPGAVKSNVYAGNKDVNWFFLNFILSPSAVLTGVTNEEGAKTQMWCSFSKAVVNGAYYESIGKGGKESSLARDSQLESKLWDWTEKELLTKGAPGWPLA
jgi:NAD(P)-dependent dehydrogenase (short-subunit alcohol dehydrogenase family)